jgi:hypothetical protein
MLLFEADALIAWFDEVCFRNSALPWACIYGDAPLDLTPLGEQSLLFNGGRGLTGRQRRRIQVHSNGIRHLCKDWRH